MFDLSQLVEITLKKPDDFLVIKETLSRIGIPSKKEKSLYQSCHILHKRGKLYIVHFKEMFLLDGKTADLTFEDIKRRNTIANLLADWGLLQLVDPEKTIDILPLNQLRIIHHSEKDSWKLIEKYHVGNKSNNIRMNA